MGINLDADPANADWTKTTWDLQGVNSSDDLRAYLKAHNMTLAQFKKLPVYTFNRDKLPWLAALDDQTKADDQTVERMFKEWDDLFMV